QGRSQAYRGFNLLLGAKGDYFYFSNRSENIVNLAPGYYGLSNQLLDCDWPKVRLGQQKLRRAQEAGFDSTSLFELLADKGGDEAFSASFIESTEYGTCASTVLNVSSEGQVNFEEQNFLPMGRKGARNQFSFVMARS
ncbi:MAG: NRDE family protein, partial [Gammaproteobacteria bacterium]|nr:NRDE family protein [Gammaproteobacteria bacterium]